MGFDSGAPYDAIHVGAAMDAIPEKLLDQLNPGGCLVGPLGHLDHQVLSLIIALP